MQTTQLEIEFIAIRCPNCDAILLDVTPTPETFSVRIKCRRCTTRRGFPVYLIVQVSLAPIQHTDIDLTPENFASA